MSDFLPSRSQRLELQKALRGRVRCTGDGHCFIYAAFEALKGELLPDLQFPDYVLSVYAAMDSFAERIHEFFPGVAASVSQVLSDIHDYIFHYRDGLEVVDYIPFVLATLYRCNVILLQPNGPLTVVPDNDVVTVSSMLRELSNVTFIAVLCCDLLMTPIS